ncbi:dynamin family protein [Photobacterium leiognathi]|uniref:dynamin family protein n=1 Tax=Photobacterium leiognathi TaxID=553611 RepID=UPI0029819A6E|nr:dynamin family protein [Photobacterium leiognathi]
MSLRQTISDDLSQLLHLAECYGNLESLNQIVQTHQCFKVRLPLVGAFSAGKSTLLNAFLGEKLLAVQVNPETCLATEIHYGDTEVIQLVNERGVVCSLTREQLKDQSFPIKNNVLTHWVDIAIPHPELQKVPELVLVDMPGWESGITQHSQAIDGYVNRSGAYCLVVSAEDGDLRESLKRVLAELKIYNMPVLLIISKCDKRLPDDIPALKEKITQSVTDVLGQSPLDVITVSARKKNIAGFTDVITLVNSQSDMIYRNSLGIQFENWLNSTIKQINVLLNQDNLTLEESRQACAQIPEELVTLKVQLQELDQQINDIVPFCSDAINRNMESSLTSQLSSLARSAMRGGDIDGIVGCALRQAFLSGVEQDFKPRIARTIKAFQNVNDLAPTSLNIQSNFKASEQGESYSGVFNDGLAVVISKIASLIPALKPFSLVIHGLASIFVLNTEQQYRQEQQLEEAKQYVLDILIPQILSQTRNTVATNLNQLADQIKQELNQETERNVAEKQQALEKLQQDLQKNENEYQLQCQQYQKDVLIATDLLAQCKG